MKVAVFDLETIADQSVIPHLSPLEADTRLKDPQKIAENIAKKESKRMEELALQPTSAMICCFGWADEKGETHHIILEEATRKAEKELLQKAWEVLADAEQFVTFNGFNFDVPVLLMRSMMRRVRPAIQISQRRYTVKNHCDIRMVLGQWDKFARGNLDFYSRILLGKPGKDGVDGSMVGDMYEMGLLDDIGQYCEDDCKVAWELYQLLINYYLL